jgi:hypothetical protein
MSRADATKPLAFAILVLVVSSIAACAGSRSTRPPPPPPASPPHEDPAPPPPPSVPAPQPPAPAAASTTRPEPPPAPGPPIALADAMERVSDADVEASLERWADGKAIDLDHVVKRVGVFLDVAPRVKWDDNKKRARDPADHDRIVTESLERAKALVAAARAGKTDEIKPLADRLLTSCVDCHTKYK